MTTGTPPITLDDVRDAAAQIKGVAHRTPVLRSRTLDQLVGAEVLLKCENFQRVGAFKFRGAYNAASRLTPEQLARGIAAYSSGNHAQAVALAARELGTTAVILMPEDVPASKRAATEGYGAEVVTYDRYSGDRVAIGEALAAERGSPSSRPTNTRTSWRDRARPRSNSSRKRGVGRHRGARGRRRTDRRYGHGGQGAPPAHPRDRRRTGGRGRHQAVPGGKPPRVRPGAAHHRRRTSGRHPGELTFSVNQRLVDEIALVSDEEIKDAMRFAFERLKIVIEPSGATPLAAPRQTRGPTPGPGGDDRLGRQHRQRAVRRAVRERRPS